MKEFKEIYLENKDGAELTLGYDEVSGKLIVRGIFVDTSRQGPPVTRSMNMFELDGEEVTLRIGERQIGKPGKIDLGSGTIVIDGNNCSLSLGGNSGRGEGNIHVNNKFGRNAIDLDGSTATVSIGESGTDGHLVFKNNKGVETARLNGRHGNLSLGGTGADGDITLKNSANEPTFAIDGNSARLFAGGTNSSNAKVILDGRTGNLTLGGPNADGDIILKSSSGENTIIMDANNASITAGGVGANGDVIVKNNQDVETVKITGSNGDIQFLNADFAEEFEIEAAVYPTITPGTVMALNDAGTLTPSQNAYDSKVVGVVAGAGDYQPALILDKNGGENRLPIAMIGKVFCQVTADHDPIQIGDLLTSSHLNGFAMKANRSHQTVGTIIGKALGSLSNGTGMIPVLINLQ